MRTIDVEHDLRIRFPERCGSFDEGVEVGLMMGKLSALPPEFEQTVAASTLEQAVKLAAGFGYAVAILQTDQDRLVLSVSRRRKRAQLRLIHDYAWG